MNLEARGWKRVPHPEWDEECPTVEFTNGKTNAQVTYGTGNNYMVDLDVHPDNDKEEHFRVTVDCDMDLTKLLGEVTPYEACLVQVLNALGL